MGGMNALERQALDLRGNMGDSPHEIKEGNFAHGGCWQYTEWLDDEGKPTRKG
jgi:hypothetical protein